jgi:hypothetical protein
MNKKDIMLASLEKNIPVGQKESAPAVPQNLEGKVVSQTEEDFAYAREKLKGLIDKSEDALDTLINLARDAEHPRAYEVLSGMLKNTADITEQLLKLQKQRKDIVVPKEQEGSNGTTTNNNTIFLGSTSELQKFLRKEKNITPVENEPKQ